jgi:hypothetical protein
LQLSVGTVQAVKQYCALSLGHVDLCKKSIVAIWLVNCCEALLNNAATHAHSCQENGPESFGFVSMQGCKCTYLHIP